VVRDHLAQPRHADVRLRDDRPMPGFYRRWCRLLSAERPRGSGADAVHAKTRQSVKFPRHIEAHQLSQGCGGQFPLAGLLSRRCGICVQRAYVPERLGQRCQQDLAIPSLPRQPGARFAGGDGYWAAAVQHGASTMKTFLLSFSAAASIAMAATALATSPARAQEYPWCANASQFGGAPLCSFATLEQCQAFLSGQAGFCQQNARAAAQTPAPRRGTR
jgi:hypothetical protein